MTSYIVWRFVEDDSVERDASEAVNLKGENDNIFMCGIHPLALLSEQDIFFHW